MNFLRYFILVFCFSTGVAVAAEQTEQEKMLAAQKLRFDGSDLEMIGMGLTQLMNDDYYIGAFYIDVAAEFIEANDLAYIDAARRMEYRFASDRKISARGFSRKIAEGIKINNSAANVKAESENLRRLLGFFKGSYKKGDIVCLDYMRGTAKVQVRKNGRLLGEIEGARDLYQLVVKTWVGDRPPSSRFKSGISGGNEDAYAVSLLRRYVNLK